MNIRPDAAGSNGWQGFFPAETDPVPVRDRIVAERQKAKYPASQAVEVEFARCENGLPQLIRRGTIHLGRALKGGSGFSPARVGAMLLRYLYLLRSSWPRTLELTYWPTLQMLIWGFMSQFLYANSSYVFRAFGVLLAAVMLWDVLFRGPVGLLMLFLEDMWARNLGHLFVTPLRPYEWVLSLLSMSLIRVLLGIVPAALLAIPLYHYSIFSMGLPLVGFFAVLLVMGWALGMAICGLILRQGMGGEGLAWTVVFTLSPISAVYYPVSTLPGWLQHAAWALPSTYVFEGMRAVLFTGSFRADYLFTGLALNIVYVGLGAAGFFVAFHNARRRGALLQMGE